MTRRERRERRAERLRGWAEKREQKSDAAARTAHTIASGIPMGQPILVGHHSEKRHRAAIDRMHRNMSNAVEHSRKADSMRSRAGNIELELERSIYSDDDDAIERLEERIAELEAERGRIKAYNASCRKGQRDYSLLDEAQRKNLEVVARVQSYAIGKNGEYPAYALQNLGGNINRNKKRLAQLKRAKESNA
jgi:hypothetical protein